jgi:hypothetical protein
VAAVEFAHEVAIACLVARPAECEQLTCQQSGGATSVVSVVQMSDVSRLSHQFISHGGRFPDHKKFFLFALKMASFDTVMEIGNYMPWVL